jgi:hypothetical protein
MVKMSGDYKYEISLLADEIALKRHGKDYYELPEPVQVAIFNEAGTAYFERKICRSEFMEAR